MGRVRERGTNEKIRGQMASEKSDFKCLTFTSLFLSSAICLSVSIPRSTPSLVLSLPLPSLSARGLWGGGGGVCADLRGPP